MRTPVAHFLIHIFTESHSLNLPQASFSVYFTTTISRTDSLYLFLRYIRFIFLNIVALSIFFVLPLFGYCPFLSLLTHSVIFYWFRLLNWFNCPFQLHIFTSSFFHHFFASNSSVSNFTWATISFFFLKNIIFLVNTILFFSILGRWFLYADISKENKELSLYFFSYHHILHFNCIKKKHGGFL